jgi:hypothetical protein
MTSRHDAWCGSQVATMQCPTDSGFIPRFFNALTNSGAGAVEIGFSSSLAGV